MIKRNRNAQILSWRGIISYSLIAEKFNVSRNVVAGIFWCADWQSKDRTSSPKSFAPNKCGIGPHGCGEYAMRTKLDTHTA